MTRQRDYDRLFAEHEKLVYTKILALVHDPQEAEDLTQETFLRVYRALPGFRGEASVKTWVLRIARNAVVDRYRRRAVRPGEQAAARDGEVEELAGAGQPSPALAAQQRRSGDCESYQDERGEVACQPKTRSDGQP